MRILVIEDDRTTGDYILAGLRQEGHVVDLSRNGRDGLLTALHVMQWMSITGRSLRDLASRVHRLPQVLVNVPGVDKDRTDDPELLAAVAAEEAELGAEGRVLLRASGTEPLGRVMVEAPTSRFPEAIFLILVRTARATPRGSMPGCRKKFLSSADRKAWRTSLGMAVTGMNTRLWRAYSAKRRPSPACTRVITGGS